VCPISRATNVELQSYQQLPNFEVSYVTMETETAKPGHYPTVSTSQPVLHCCVPALSPRRFSYFTEDAKVPNFRWNCPCYGNMHFCISITMQRIDFTPMVCERASLGKLAREVSLWLNKEFQPKYACEPNTDNSTCMSLGKSKLRHGGMFPPEFLKQMYVKVVVLEQDYPKSLFGFWISVRTFWWNMS